jgi:hypothetical protein
MKVLISPVSIEEARGILDTGVDIMDVKNVNEGSLGAQFPWITKQVVEMCSGPGIKVSATLGDLPFKPGTGGLAAYGCATTGASYVKAGLHGCKTADEAFQMMDTIRKSVRMVSDTADVVAAGYADWRKFGGLSAMDLVKAANDSQCDVVMVDTAIKDGSTLFDCMSIAELKDFCDAAKSAGMIVALAGSLKSEHAEWLFDINPDLIGVRGAVCGGPTRKSAICPDKTRAFVEYFHAGAKAVA